MGNDDIPEFVKGRLDLPNEGVRKGELYRIVGMSRGYYRFMKLNSDEKIRHASTDLFELASEEELRNLYSKLDSIR